MNLVNKRVVEFADELVMDFVEEKWSTGIWGSVDLKFLLRFHMWQFVLSNFSQRRASNNARHSCNRCFANERNN
jgi:hypothetical protein